MYIGLIILKQNVVVLQPKVTQCRPDDAVTSDGVADVPPYGTAAAGLYPILTRLS